MPSPAPPRLLPGDPAPWFHAAHGGNPRFALASVAGRYVVLALAGPDPVGQEAAHRTLLAARQAELLDDDRATAILLSPAASFAEAPPDAIPGLRTLLDADRQVAAAFGAAERPLAVLLDPLLRVIACGPLGDLPSLLALLARLPPPALHAGQESPAPVLLLPRILEPEFCRHLIALYDAQGGEESGFMVADGERTIGRLDRNHKVRRDLLIEDAEVQAGLRARIQRRLVPEIRKAFQFHATRIERYIVACYDAAEGGHFRAHRDNTTPATAHRRFAVSINLNEGFEGGELWFPEFGPRRYRPPLGGACVFSCSLLHEATPVTRGLRYATLPFLYDDAAAALREANRHSLVPGPSPARTEA
jgi:predicted 2-oxoglutarate/Fe(II)-dependent dioxygenase YbiX